MNSQTQTNSAVTWDDLSSRQQDIMLCLARGMSNQEIADHLGIKLSTVRNTIAEVYDWIQVSNRVQALLWVLSYQELADEVLENG